MTDTVIVEETADTVVVQEESTQLVEVVTAGPQGSQGIQGLTGEKGDTGDVTPAATAAKVAAEAAAASAASSQTAAAGSASSASVSQSAAAGSATAAATSASTASTQATNAATSATNAAGSATAAAESAVTAVNQATAATTQASNAATSATNAAASATTATTKATEAATSATSASGSASSAATSASTATTKASEASASAATATSMATAAEIAAAGSLAHEQTAAEHSLDASTSADNANTSAVSALASKNSATASATAAAASAASVGDQANVATTQAGIATTQATAAAADRVQTGIDASLASASKDDAAASKLLAQAWATQAEDVPVIEDGTDFSSLHWAAKSQISQGIAGAFATNAVDAAAAAIQARDDAVAVVTGGTASLTPAAGKMPIAGASGKIDQEWFDPLPGVNSAALHRSPNAVTAMFLYDTSKDSDGGAWTEKCQHTSWYNEALTGKWLGAQVSEFYARNSSPTLGAENALNGGFDTDTVWTKGTGWSIAGGVATKAAGTAAYLSQTTTFVSGKTYQFVFTVSNRTAGSVGARLENATATLRSTNETFVEYITTNSNNPRIILSADNSFNGSVDLVSVREVTALNTSSNDYFQLTTDGKFYKLNPTSGITEVFRGNKRKFPKLAGIVAEAANVTIYDLTEPARPMWMRFMAGGEVNMISSQSGNTANSVSATNTVLLVGIGGQAGVAVNRIEFFKDGSFNYNSGGPACGVYRGNIADRNAGRGRISAFTNSLHTGSNAVAMTVLPDAPVDPVTGLKVPTIACLPGESLVRMADGSDKRIDEVRTGDTVKTLEGEHRVLNFFDQGVKNVIELGFDDGKRLVCTPDHKIRTTDGWVEAGDLTEAHEVVGL